MDELENVIAAPEDNIEELSRHISDFLETQEKTDRLIFMGRYFHAVAVKDLAKRTGMTPNHVSTRLYRLRERLRAYLLERGYSL